MEAITLILQRFLNSLVSGCIINMFVILNFFVLDKKNYLPEHLKFIKEITVLDTYSVLIFIMSAVISGIVIEGIAEVGFQCYKRLYDERRLYVQKKELLKKLLTKFRKIFSTKKNETSEETSNKTRKTFIGFILWHFIRKVGIVEACLSFTNKDETDVNKRYIKNPFYTFMCDHNIFLPNEAMLICEKYIIKKANNSEVTRFKDLSFIIQLARISFLLISAISFIATLLVTVLWIFGKCDAFISLITFYLSCSVIAVLFVVLVTPMASDFGKRYVRDVGRWYQAIKIMDSENNAKNHIIED